MKHFEISHLEICRTFIINQLFIYQLIFSRFNMRGYAFVYSIHHISFLRGGEKKKNESVGYIIYFWLTCENVEKSSLEKNEFIETSSIKFREMFFFSLSLPFLFEINFSNISIQCENNKSRKISAFSR